MMPNLDLTYGEVMNKLYLAFNYRQRFCATGYMSVIQFRHYTFDQKKMYYFKEHGIYIVKHQFIILVKVHTHNVTWMKMVGRDLRTETRLIGETCFKLLIALTARILNQAFPLYSGHSQNNRLELPVKVIAYPYSHV